MTDEGNPVHIKTFIWQEWNVARELNDILIVFYLHAKLPSINNELFLSPDLSNIETFQRW